MPKRDVMQPLRWLRERMLAVSTSFFSPCISLFLGVVVPNIIVCLLLLTYVNNGGSKTDYVLAKNGT